MSHVLRQGLSLLLFTALAACQSTSESNGPGDASMSALDAQPPAQDSMQPGADATPVPMADAAPNPRDGSAPTHDGAAPPRDAAMPSQDAARPAVDATPSVNDGGASPIDAGRPVDAAAPVGDAIPGGPDAAPVMPDAALGQPDAAPMNPDAMPVEEPPYEGLGLAPVDSNLQLRAHQLEATAADGAYISFLVDRLLPRVEGSGDTSHLQPWVMYRPGDGPEWTWFLMAFYLPAADVARLPPANQRVEAGRVGPWYRGIPGGRAEVPVGGAAASLADADAPAVCGGAQLSARFQLRLPDGATIDNVVGVVQTVHRTEQLDLNWLNGCGRAAVP